MPTGKLWKYYNNFFAIAKKFHLRFTQISLHSNFTFHEVKNFTLFHVAVLNGGNEPAVFNDFLYERGEGLGCKLLARRFVDDNPFV